MKAAMQTGWERTTGLTVVVAVHAAALYGLWSYRIIPSPLEAATVFVRFVSEAPVKREEPPKPPKPEKKEPPRPVEEPHHHLAAEAPIVAPDEPVAPAPPVQEFVPQPVVESPPAPPQPVLLSSDLAVSCPQLTKPVYSLQSKRLGEEGRVVLRVEMDEEGKVVSAAVKTSSGYARLDDAALTAVKAWRCQPAKRDGVAVRAVALQPFNFILEGR